MTTSVLESQSPILLSRQRQQYPMIQDKNKNQANRYDQLLYFSSFFALCISLIIIYNVLINFAKVKESSFLTITTSSSSNRMNNSEYQLKLTELNLIAAIFLLILAVSGNFVAETFSCQMQRFLSKNMLAKNVVVFMLIFFTLTFTTKTTIHPKVHFQRSLSIYITFLLFNKMELGYSMVAVMLLFSILIIKNYLDYYQATNTSPNAYKESLPLIFLADFLFIIVLFVICFGFLKYFFKQFRDHYTQFNIIQFLFGKPVCFHSV